MIYTHVDRHHTVVDIGQVSIQVELFFNVELIFNPSKVKLVCANCNTSPTWWEESVAYKLVPLIHSCQKPTFYIIVVIPFEMCRGSLNFSVKSSSKSELQLGYYFDSFLWGEWEVHSSAMTSSHHPTLVQRVDCESRYRFDLRHHWKRYLCGILMAQYQWPLITHNNSRLAPKLHAIDPRFYRDICKHGGFSTLRFSTE